MCLRYTVIMNFVCREGWNLKGSGVNLDYQQKRLGSFETIQEAHQYVRRNLRMLEDVNKGTFYINEVRPGKEAPIFYYRYLGDILDCKDIYQSK